MTCNLEATPIESVKKIDSSKIDPMANYLCRIQVGARKRWRRFSGGRIDTKKNDDKTLSVTHVPAVHMTRPIKGDTLMGLVESHNRWIDDNRSRATLTGTVSTINRSKATQPVQDTNGPGPIYKGDVAKQLLVTHFEETDEPSEDYKIHRNPVDMLRYAISESAKDIIAAARDDDKTRSRKSTSRQDNDK